jgi:initiation factor 1A
VLDARRSFLAYLLFPPCSFAHPPTRSSQAAEGELYAQVMRILGSSRFTVRCTDGAVRCMIMMRPLRRACALRVGDLVLAQRVLCATVDSKCYMVAKLTLQEAQQVRREGSIPLSWDGGVLCEDYNENIGSSDAVLQWVGEEEYAAADDEEEVDMADL